ncbi:MAG: preprotein translocase subunit SecY [Armatimonadetes bacterium]|nr:preprotein translocase subunit SecY [Armatimonadota bacterium]
MKERLANLAQALRLPDVRKRLLFVMAAFAVYVACAHVPLPGIDKEALENFFRGSGMGFANMLNKFAGGSLQRFSVLALGIMPYINASIIFQLLGIAVPALEELQKEGEYGKKKIAQWTKYLTVALALMQAGGVIAMFQSQGIFIGGFAIRIFDIVMMTAGCMFLYWLGEQITDKGIGQGISLLIFVGIMTSMPEDVALTIQLWKGGQIQILNILFLMAIFLAVIYLVVMVQQAQRKIPVQYAKRVRGHRVYGGTSSFLPLRVNAAGVIPIIFAVSILMFPGTIIQFLRSEKIVGAIASTGIPEASVWNVFFYIQMWSEPGRSVVASILYFLLVIVFTYFYTTVTFNPERIAEDLQKNGGSVPGIRPGHATRDHLDRILYRITLAGAIFLGFIAVIQYYVGPITKVTTFSLVGGTSLLIVVGVALDTMQQIEAQLLMREYKGFLD